MSPEAVHSLRTSPEPHNSSVPHAQEAPDTIRLPGNTGKPCGGFVTVIHDGKSITVQYNVKMMELILALNTCYITDEAENNPPETRGWRSYDTLAHDLHSHNLATLQHKVYRINKKFRAAVERKFPGRAVPDLITTKRGMGIRLSRIFQVDVP